MFWFDEVQQCYLNEIFFILAILKSFEGQQCDRLLGKAVMFLFLLGKHDCLFGMVAYGGVWSNFLFWRIWSCTCPVLPNLPGCSSSLPSLDLVFVGFNLHN